MEVRYRREMNHNYMIMDAPASETGYECRMLAGNHIEGLLKFRMRYGEEKREFYYEITSRQPLKRVLEKRKATGEEIRRILLAIISTALRAEEYLLREEQLLLDPDYIYVDPDRFSVELCLLPGYSGSWPTALSSLLQFLLERADHQDKDGVVLAYNLYQESLKENYGAADLLKHLSPSEDRIFSLPEEEKEESSPGKGGAGFRKEESGPGKGEAGVRKRNSSPNEEEVGFRKRNSGSNEEEVGFRKGDKRPNGEMVDLEKRENGSKEGEGRKRRGTVHRRNRSFPLWKGILALMAVEGLIWYVTGSGSLWMYGIVAAAGFAVLLVYVQTGKEPHSMEKGTGCSPREELRRPQTGDWEMKVEREDIYQARMREEEEEEMRKSREEGTVLLTAVDKNSRIGVLESLSRDAESIEIPYVPFIVGKHPQMTDYCLPRPTVSRLHLRIDRKENVCILTDLNSTNGTIVNGYRLQANETVSIKNGDILYLAEVGYKFSENLFL